ncbi:MAG TPA: hypothetical protein ENH82_13840 [bacterium]|nr:hypothetical protein [bacterium]
MAITGLVGFLAKIWFNRIHTREKAGLNEQLVKIKGALQATNMQLQSALDKSLHINAVQFDAEFQTYQELWSKLVQIRKAIRELDLETTPDTETKREAFDTAVDEFPDMVEQRRPFFPATIAKHLFHLIDLVSEEAKNREEQRGKSDRDRERYTGAEAWKTINFINAQSWRNMREMSEVSDKICELIRGRITGTVVN